MKAKRHGAIIIHPADGTLFADCGRGEVSIILATDADKLEAALRRCVELARHAYGELVAWGITHSFIGPSETLEAEYKQTIAAARELLEDADE